MKKILLFLLVLLIKNPANSQVRLQHLFGGAGYDDVQEVIQTADLGFIMCGTTESFGSGLSDILVIKTDDAGVVQWSKAYGSTGNDYGVAIKKAPAGGYVVAGYTYGLSADTLTDDFLLFNISSTGNVLWAKTFGGAANDEAHALSVMPDSGFVIAGTTGSFGASSNQAGFVVRTDASGNKLWSKAITQNSDQQLFSVDATSDGGCIVAGYTYVSSFRLFDIFLSKLNANGSKQWVRSYGGVNTEQAYSVKEVPTGGFVVSGYTQSFGTGGEDAFILRTDANGDVTWFNAYGTSASERSRTVLWTPGNAIMISGEAEVASPVGPIDHNFLLEADTLGGVMWSRTYGPTQNISLPYSTALCADGGFVMGGITGGFGALQNDIYLVKTTNIGGSGCNQANPQLFNSTFTPTDSSGGTFTNGGVENTVTVIKTNAPVTTSIQCNSTGVGIGENENKEDIMLYPNPASGSVTVSLNVIYGSAVKIEVTGLRGEKLLELITPAYTNKITLPLDHLENGLYFIRITEGTTTSISRLVIQK